VEQPLRVASGGFIGVNSEGIRVGEARIEGAIVDQIGQIFAEHGSDIRMDLLVKLAEQAMNDPEFRAVARVDLLEALEQFGYQLTEHELDIVMRFRDALEESGIDLFLNDKMDGDYQSLLAQAFG